ncbi:hypothetical protein D3C80_2231890 [compost metagenome]
MFCTGLCAFEKLHTPRGLSILASAMAAFQAARSLVLPFTLASDWASSRPLS